MSLDIANALRSERKRVGKATHTRAVYYFKCSTCPTEIAVYGHNLKHSKGRCKQCLHRKEPFRYLYTALTYAANYAQKPLELTFPEFLSFTDMKECHYCGDTIQWFPFGTYKIREKTSMAYFLDRKNNALGYSKDNCVVCCKTCNYTRQARYSYEEFMLLSPVLRTIKILRKGI